MKVLFLVPPSRYETNVARDLVYGCWCKGKRIAGLSFPPVTMLTMAKILKDSGQEAEVIDASYKKLGIPEVVKLCAVYDCVVMLVSTMSINEDAEILAGIKKAKPGIKTLVFGSHPTFEAQSTVSKEGIDIAVRGEGEYAIRNLIKAFSQNNCSWKTIKGITYKNGNEVIHNPDYPLIEDLDKLPIPDRKMLGSYIHYYNPVVKREPFTTLFTSRGCPGRCSFCSSPAFYGKNIRFRSAAKVIEELKEISALGYKEVFLRDETFTFNKQRVADICNGIIKNKLDLTWICSSRVDMADYETMKLMKQAGCHMIRFGVESGVQQLLDNICKSITIEQIEKAFLSAQKAGLDTHAHLMLGLPGETTATVKQTIEFVKKLNPSTVTFGIMTPFPGTRIFEELKMKNPKIGDGSSLNMGILHDKGFYSSNFTSLSDALLASLIKEAYGKFYLRPAYVWQWIKRIKTPGELRRVFKAAFNLAQYIFQKRTA